MVRVSVFRTISAVAAALLVLVSLPAEAQWKWKDKGGRIQYSDLPPPADTPEGDILSRPTTTRRAPNVIGASPTASAASGASAPTLAVARPAPKVDPELEAKMKKAEADAAAKKKADEEKIAAAKSENCNRARDQLRTFDSGVRVFRVNAKGEREYVDDKQRADETKHARDVIAADCPK